MTAFVLTEQPSYQPGDTVAAMIVGDSGSPSADVTDREGEAVARGQQRQCVANYGWLKVPQIDEWGTLFTLLKSPADLSVPIPIAQRAGSTLWFSDSPSMTSGSQLIEWVEPDRWYVVASHMSTDHVWWDIAEWGGGFGSTLSVETPVESPDSPLLLIAAGQPLAIAAIEFQNRTLGHDEMMMFADARSLPGDPLSAWNLNLDNSLLVGRDDTTRAISMSAGSAMVASWDATGPRARKRAVELRPTIQSASKQFTFQADMLGTYTIRLTKRNFAFVDCAHPPVRTTTPMVSLIDTPMPAEDEPPR